MKKKEDKLSILEGKLRQPIHISYISKYILKTTVEETKEILKQAIEENIIEESGYAKDYYVLKGFKVK